MKPASRGWAVLLAGMSCLGLGACTYGPPVTQVHVVNVSREPDSRLLGVLVQKTVIRAPTGLSTFPDGGRTKVLSDEAQVYLYDVDGGWLRKLRVHPAPEDQFESFAPWLKGWDGGALYLATSGCAPTWDWNRGCWGPHVTSQFFRLGQDGSFVRSPNLPATLREGGNSPSVALPGETHYTRVGWGPEGVSVRVRETDALSRVLVFDARGELVTVGKSQ